MESGHEDQPPAKKARLSPVASPTMSDDFSDPDDLYDTPVKAQTSSAPNVPHSSLPQPAAQTLTNDIPGLNASLISSQPTTRTNTHSSIASQPQSTPQELQSSIGKTVDAGDSALIATTNTTAQRDHHLAQAVTEGSTADDMGRESELKTAFESGQQLGVTLQSRIETSDSNISQAATLREGFNGAALSEPTVEDRDGTESEQHRQEVTRDVAGAEEESSLADFQVQLQLLEQEHTRQLLMKRQEEERNNRNNEDLNPHGDNDAETVTAPGTVEGIEGALEVAEAETGDGTAEFEYDSSPIADDDDSSESSEDSSNASESEDDYELLDPAEMARILMRDGGEDEDERPKGGKNNTKNETEVPKVPKPDVVVTSDMEIKELGHVENIVENYVLVKGTLSGETQVLESGSVLCLEDRKVIGAVDDLVGRVEEPRYSVAFTNGAEVAEYGVTHGTKIFYVVDHSSYVFTQPLRNMKGYDTSNMNDEEAGVEELEFSDDEAEAEYKRKLKQEKLARKGIVRQEPNAEVGQQATSGSADVALQYDDDEAEDLYKPLPRPVDYGSGTASIETRPHFARGRGRGRGGRDRGDRGGRGRGGRGGRGNDSRGRGGRGGFSQSDVVSSEEPSTQPGSLEKSLAHQTGMSASPIASGSARPPQLTPSAARSGSTSQTMNTVYQPPQTTYPPAAQYNSANAPPSNFGSQGQSPAPYGNQFPNYPGVQGYPQSGYNGYGQTPYPPPGQYPVMPFPPPQPGFGMPPPGSFINPNFYQQFASQQQQHQQSHPQHLQQQYRGNPNQQQQGWQNHQQNHQQNYRQ